MIAIAVQTLSVRRLPNVLGSKRISQSWQQ